MRFLWITDPWATLDHRNDTTLRLAEAALALGHECHWCDTRAIALLPGRGGSAVRVRATRIRELSDGRAQARLGPERALDPATMDQVHYRVDPPVDLRYLHPLLILAAGGAAARIVNPPRLLTSSTEKLLPLALGKLFPPTCVSSRESDLMAFLAREGRAVLKPLHQAQSKGVELLEKGDRARLESATEGFSVPVALQRYLEGVREGERRLWFVDGRLLAHVVKRPAKGEFRIDMDRGGKLEARALPRSEAKAAQAIGRALRGLGARLAAVDLIEGFVTDFNVTSPGLLVGMERVLGEDLATGVIQALSRR